MGKFFTTTLRPTITASLQDGSFLSGDIVFDWHSFKLPKGASRLISTTIIIPPINGGIATARDVHLYFAKPNISGTAPSSLGTVSATADGTGYVRDNLLTALKFDTTDWLSSLDFHSVISTGGGGGNNQIPSIVLDDDKNNSSSGYQTFYCAMVAAGTLDFRTEIRTTGTVDVSGLSTATVSSLDDGSGGNADPANSFSVGDVIHVQDDIILGEIASMTATAITFRHDGVNNTPADFAAWQVQNGAGAAGDLANNDELFNINPITIRLAFER